MSGSQLDRWVARLDTTGSVIKEEKQTGAEPSLQRWERDVTSGWVLHENEHGNEVTLEAFHDFVLGKFSIELSNATISKYLSEDGFACRLGKKKGKGFMIDIESLRAMLWKWVLIQDFRDRKIKREKFASIDFTFTGHRNERRTTFAPKGGAQPMLKDRGSNFTNCIVTCLWADGENRTPSMLFTYNSAFRRDRSPTLKRTEQVQHLLDYLDKYGISEDRIVYIGNEKNETRKYARECPDLVRRFFSHYKVSLRPPSLAMRETHFSRMVIACSVRLDLKITLLTLLQFTNTFPRTITPYMEVQSRNGATKRSKVRTM